MKLETAEVTLVLFPLIGLARNRPRAFGIFILTFMHIKTVTVFNIKRWNPKVFPTNASTGLAAAVVPGLGTCINKSMKNVKVNMVTVAHTIGKTRETAVPLTELVTRTLMNTGATAVTIEPKELFIRTSRPFPPFLLFNPPNTGPIIAPSKYTEKFVMNVLTKQMVKVTLGSERLDKNRTFMFIKLTVIVTSVAPPHLMCRNKTLSGTFTIVHVTKPLKPFSTFSVPDMLNRPPNMTFTGVVRPAINETTLKRKTTATTVTTPLPPPLRATA